MWCPFKARRSNWGCLRASVESYDKTKADAHARCSEGLMRAYFVEKVGSVLAFGTPLIVVADLLFRPICWAAGLEGVLRVQIIS